MKGTNGADTAEALDMIPQASDRRFNCSGAYSVKPLISGFRELRPECRYSRSAGAG
ncbi:hypothetical protein EMIT0P395_60158 [Pseudomonas sp. IT-P395]